MTKHPQILLDQKDRMILDQLTLDARAPLSRIKATMPISEQVLHYRIKNLMKNKIISGFFPVVRLDKLGFGIFRCMFRIERANHEKEKQIIDHFLKNRNVYQLASTTGRWSLAVDFVAKDVNSFFDILQDAPREFGDNLRNFNLMTLANSFFFRRKYLINFEAQRKAIVFGGENNLEKLKEKDALILRKLFENSRQKNHTIGKKIGVSQSTVKSRIRKMEERGLIQGYSAFIHPMVFGVSCKNVLLRIFNGPDVDSRICEFSENEPNVLSMEKLIGKWNYELKCEFSNESQYMEFMRKLKDSFADVIYDYEIVNLLYNYNVGFNPEI